MNNQVVSCESVHPLILCIFHCSECSAKLPTTEGVGFCFVFLNFISHLYCVNVSFYIHSILPLYFYFLKAWNLLRFRVLLRSKDLSKNQLMIPVSILSDWHSLKKAHHRFLLTQKSPHTLEQGSLLLFNEILWCYLGSDKRQAHVSLRDIKTHSAV